MATLSQPVSAAEPAPLPERTRPTWPRDLVFALSLGLTMRLGYWLYGW